MTGLARADAGFPAGAQVPPGCRRYSVELRKPLGMVLEEDRHGAIYVVRSSCHSKVVFTMHTASGLGRWVRRHNNRHDVRSDCSRLAHQADGRIVPV